MIMGSFDRIATETVRDHETVTPVHEVLRVLGERARAGAPSPRYSVGAYQGRGP